MLDINIVGGHTQLSSDDLSKGCLVSLTLRLYTDTRKSLAGRMDANFAAIEHLNACNVEVFARASAHNLGKGRDANAHQFATRTLLSLLPTQPFIVHVLHG